MNALLAEKVAFLRLASSYGEKPARVDAIETHMSWVFLTATLVYKLKKPVRFDYLDFSTLEARRRNCENEIHLNRRLAPDIYLGVVPLVRLGNGGLRLCGLDKNSGAVVDWLVKMRRLPAQRMLDTMIRNDTIQSDDVNRLGGVLSAFYQQAEKLAITPQAYGQHIEREIRNSATELCRLAYELNRDVIRRLVTWQIDFIKHHGEHLAQRARDGRIVEAHGDLRPEHVCLLPIPVVIDALEFNREFRMQDAVDELAYLALECERLGNRDIGEQLLQFYQQASGDVTDAALIGFYKTYRACLRAKIAVWHISDPAKHHSERWQQRARTYLALAQRYARDAGAPGNRT